MRRFAAALITISITATLQACGGAAGPEGIVGAGGDPAVFEGGDPLSCDLAQYTASGGPTATMEHNTLLGTWPGTAGADLRLRLGLEDAQPIVRDLAVRPQGGQWRRGPPSFGRTLPR